MDLRAKQFFTRAKQAQTPQGALLCLFNSFFVLYHDDAYSKMADICGLDEKTVREAIECCQEDYEGERTVLPENAVSLLASHLESVLR